MLCNRQKNFKNLLFNNNSSLSNLNNLMYFLSNHGSFFLKKNKNQILHYKKGTLIKLGLGNKHTQLHLFIRNCQLIKR